MSKEKEHTTVRAGPEGNRVRDWPKLFFLIKGFPHFVLLKQSSDIKGVIGCVFLLMQPAQAQSG
jgi:hypothetical protein